MSRSIQFTAGAALVASVAMVAALAQQHRTERETAARHISADDVEFEELVPNVSRHVLWGDAERGPHAAFLRFSPDYTAPTHTHTHDVRIVVLEGAYIYIANGERKRVGQGEFLLIPAGVPHGTATDEQDGALFYTELSGPFDLKPVE